MTRETLGGLMMIGLTFAGIYIWLTGSSAQASTSATGEIPRERSPVVDGAMQGWLGILDYLNPFADDGDGTYSFEGVPNVSTPSQSNQSQGGGDLLSGAEQLGLYPSSSGNNYLGGLLGFASTSTPVATSANAQDLLARTVWGEAASEGFEGMQAVASVIFNRVKSGKTGEFGKGIVGVILKSGAFSMWGTSTQADINLGNKARAANAATPAFAAAMHVASLAVAGQLPDNTGGALFYFNVPNLKNGKLPTWAVKAKLTKTAAVGQHTFYDYPREV